MGELDMANVHRVREAFAVRESDEDLVLNLAQLQFTDTSGVSVVVEIWRESLERGFSLRLVPAPSRVDRIFEVAGLTDVLPWDYS